jgi:competence protein ComEA
VRLKPGEKVDADKATAAELARVPGIGVGLAKRMVEDRVQHGPFGGLAGLDRVPGVGPGKLSRIAPYLAFSGVSPTSGAIPTRSGREPGPMNFGPAPILPSLASGPTVVGGVQDRTLPSSHPGSDGADLNTADSVGLLQISGIGPAKAGTIARWRADHGPFRSPDDLARIPGIGPKTAAKLWAAGGPR